MTGTPELPLKEVLRETLVVATDASFSMSDAAELRAVTAVTT